jgi:hypothetical protein
MAITPKTRRVYKGGATPTTITTALSDDAAAISITASTGWPTVGPFYVVIDPGLSTEEKIYVGAISGTSLSSMVRGQDDTTGVAHGSGAAIYPVFTATDADEANQLTATYTTKGGLVYMGDPSFTQLAIGSTAGHPLKVSASGVPEWGQLAEAGIATNAVTGDKIAPNAVTSEKIENGTIVDADVNASAAIALSKLATGALPTAITVASANVVNGSLLTTDFDTTTAVASGGVPVITVSASGATGGKAGDVWVVV